MRRGYDVRQTAIVREDINNVQAKRAGWNKNYGKCYEEALSRLDSRNVPELKNQRIEKYLDSHLPTNYSKIVEKENKNEKLTNESKNESQYIEDEVDCFDAFEMKRPSTSTFNLLYEGVSKENEGRDSYLKVRRNIPPKIKYEFPVSVNLEYGWHIKEKAASYAETPKFAKTNMERSWYRNNKAFNTPPGKGGLSSAMK